jgi:phenylalanyl-tRNA synthetase alpha chain
MDLAQEKKSFLSKFKEADSHDSLNSLKIEYLGKKGILSSLMSQLSNAPAEKKPKLGKSINEFKSLIEESISSSLEKIEQSALDDQLSKEAIDVTLPLSPEVGSYHPVSLIAQEISNYFKNKGYVLREGPEIESEYFNFSALNIPENHPARDMHDTFYFENGNLLRTHTSPVQIRSMELETPPLKILCPGKVFRCDSDQTHTPMFHQVEGLVVDKDINFAHLKNEILEFVESFFKDNPKVRFRPSYFPFTEPSVEVDIQGENGWLEIMGCGMVHPNVLKNVGLNPEIYSGFAFGMGIERMTMLRYQISDIRMLFENDLRFVTKG